jgi:hypothetical protein
VFLDSGSDAERVDHVEFDLKDCIDLFPDSELGVIKLVISGKVAILWRRGGWS